MVIAWSLRPSCMPKQELYAPAQPLACVCLCLCVCICACVCLCAPACLRLARACMPSFAQPCSLLSSCHHLPRHHPVISLAFRHLLSGTPTSVWLGGLACMTRPWYTLTKAHSDLACLLQLWHTHAFACTAQVCCARRARSRGDSSSLAHARMPLCVPPPPPANCMATGVRGQRMHAHTWGVGLWTAAMGF